MEKQPWETRSGEQLPDMSPKQGEDFAAMQRRQAAPKRERASLEQQRHQDQARRRAKLEEHALNERVKEMLQGRPAKIAAGVVVALLVGWFLVWPRIDSILNPVASYDNLQSTLPQINLAASKALGGEAPAKIISKDGRWIVNYKLNQGSSLFNGRRATATCGVGFSVLKDQPSQSILQWQQLVTKRCH